MRESFPTMEEVEKADRQQIAKWHFFLHPFTVANEQEIIQRIADRFLNMGGLTPGLGNEIGLAETADSSRTVDNAALPHQIAKPGASRIRKYKGALLFKAS